MLSRFLSNAALAATAPLLLSAATLYGDGLCQRKENQVYLTLRKSDFAPLFTFGGIAAGAIAGYQFYVMAREEKGKAAITFPSMPSLPGLPQPETGLIRGASLNFFKEVFLNPDGSEKAFHANFAGITGDGKTTLAETLIEVMAQGNQVYLVNPKHRVSQPEWSFQPVCTNINEALDVLKTLEEMMGKRLTDPNFDESLTPISYIVIDELDWICSHHGTKATKTIRNLLKVSRSANFRVILCGQSAQLGASGFDSSDFRQTNRFILGSEAVAYLSNPQLKWDATPYKDTVNQWQREGQRFTLVCPTKGQPFLQLLPTINRQIPNPLISAPSLSLEEDYQLTEITPKDPPSVAKLFEISSKHGWLSASKAKQFCRDLRPYSPAQIREIFQQLSSEGQGYLRGEGDALEWRLNRVE